MPNFEAWKATGVQALITGRTVKDGARLRTEFRLWEIAAGQQAAGQQLATDATNWRRIAHLVSDAVWEKIIGEKAISTRVWCLSMRATEGAAPQTARHYGSGWRECALPDLRSDLVVTPRFSPNSQSIAYMAFSQGGDARVFVHQLETNQREAVGNFQGMSFSPRFSPQGNRLIMSLQQGSASNIYAYDLASRAHLTPDGRRIHRHLTILFAGRDADCV